MIAIAKNLGEPPLFYADSFENQSDGTVLVKKNGLNASQQPQTGSYQAAYGSFTFVPQSPEGGWERATLNGQIISFKANGVGFGYCWYRV